MPMIQKNLYTPGQNLNNQAENIDLNRVADDKSFITVNFGTSPATVTIKVGSLIEVNGNQYAAETSDIVFQMSNASHNYITYNGTTYASSASIGTFDSLKAGYYTGTARTLKWYIDQTNGIYYQDNRIYNGRGSIGQRDYSYQGFGMSKFSAYRTGSFSSSGIVVFNIESFDIKSEYNNSNGVFTAADSGYYFFESNLVIQATTTPTTLHSYMFYNGATIIAHGNATSIPSGNLFTPAMTSLIYLNAGDTILINVSVTTGTFTAPTSNRETHFSGYMIV